MNWSHESEKHVLQGNNMGSSRSSPGPPATCYSHLTAETFHRNTCKKRRREAPPVTFLYIRSTERANAEQCVLAALQHPPEPCSFVLSFGNGSEKWFWLNFRKLLWQQKKIKESLKRIPFVRDGVLLATENLLLTFLGTHTHTPTHPEMKWPKEWHPPLHHPPAVKLLLCHYQSTSERKTSLPSSGEPFPVSWRRVPLLVARPNRERLRFVITIHVVFCTVSPLCASVHCHCSVSLQECIRPAVHIHIRSFAIKKKGCRTLETMMTRCDGLFCSRGLWWNPAVTYCTIYCRQRAKKVRSDVAALDGGAYWL